MTFVTNPFEILDPLIRWIPSQEELGKKGYEQLLPPLVHKIREEVKKWRNNNYKPASETSRLLLNFWFNTKHIRNGVEFKYYFAQREAIESIIYLYEVVVARDKYELLKFDSSGRVSTGMLPENWIRYVIKMATGSGKTKVASLVVVWSYFHKLYEENSLLSKNFLLLAPNIIVLNRLRKDFEALKIFREDPLIPDDGFKDRSWHSDFQITLHLQDELKAISPSGNLFLSNIHRVFLSSDHIPSLKDEDLSDFFLGQKPSPSADKDKGMDLGELLRGNRLKDLVVINDEAHHIHDEKLAWFRNIEDINNTLKLKYGNGISLQVDFTATPRHNNGAIFVQTISDYPLVEAIKQNIVKMPVLPDEVSRARLKEKESDKFVEHYEDYIHLGYVEWKKQYEEIKRAGKTPILFIMTTETKESDEVAEYLETRYPEFKNAVLVIHTNKSGEIVESKAKKERAELEKLRKAADAIDSDSSPYKVVVSVLMLREGWDVKNVTTLVGLRPYSAKSNILPEQTLGRGLRKIFPREITEELCVIGTSAFLEFVESIKNEGVELGYRSMGETARGNSPIVIEPDKENTSKDLEILDIQIPVLTPRLYREYKKLEEINIDKFNFTPVELKTFSEEEKKEIVFKDIEGQMSHITVFEGTLPDYRSVVAFFSKAILKDSRLVSGFDVLYPKVRDFIKDRLFGKAINLEDLNVLRNLSEVEAKNTLFKVFKKAIDELTITDKGAAEVKNYIKLRETKPFPMNYQEYITPKKSIFNKVVGDNRFELEFAVFLDNCEDIISFTKNTYSVNFRIEYQGEDGNIHDYYPDFLIKQKESLVYVIETKGREDFDDARKINRLNTWCVDVNKVQTVVKYMPLYVKQEDWEKYRNSVKKFEDVVKLFKVG
ncbi:Type III restriction enzyme, res subunit [Candidatus Brocadiaceae bacterium B188]|nr:DEAD/DEAH box helicase family protein [Candidatus Brocadia sapporoensis]QQR65649.1 MAG: DEAD/DEAH box helicase family protein [Candidatus Brocadia sp.]RZV59850.1 MAG: type III restriction endonuclease subunit R [Candidatus Brocadia sp. BROELEC01]TWU49961.1 Type III restriction enzyme, res subunit [Candidatus Brocadiaceae bacterium B188]